MTSHPTVTVDARYPHATHSFPANGQRTALSRTVSKLFLRATALSLLAITPKIEAGFVASKKDFPYFEQHSQLFVLEKRSDETSPPKLPDFDPRNAAMLAQSSLLSYVDDPEFIADSLGKAGFEDVVFFDSNGTFAYLAESDSDLILVFRGTENGDLTDVSTNFKLPHKDFTEHGRAHRGFVRALEKIEPELTQALRERIQASPEKRVWLAGHSQGGALATLFGILNADTVHAIYVIGCPQVVNHKLAKSVHDSLPLFRIVNNNDIIPRLPSMPFYRHIGSTYFLSSQGELLVDPSRMNAWKDRLRGHGEYTLKLFKEHWSKIDFAVAPSDYFADHSPRLYSQVLAELANET